MAQPCCPVSIFCPGQQAGDLEFDFPLANYSSESPDQFLFFAVDFGWDINTPPIGSQFDNPSFPAFCQSTLSQDDADICAKRLQFGGVVDGTPPWNGPNNTPINPVGNDLQQCSWTCPDGSLFTWTVFPGAVVSFNKAQANEIASSLACNLARTRNICLPTLANGCLNQPYTDTIAPIGAGLAPFVFTIVSGSLPPGLAFAQTSPTSATIAGTPTQAGNFTFTLNITDARGNFMTKNITLPVIGVTNLNSIPLISPGIPYSASLAISGGVTPYNVSIQSGSLPQGIVMDSSGNFSGTTSQSGSFAVNVLIVDSANNTCTVPVTLAIISYIICNWSTAVLPAMTFPAGHNSTKPAWNGIFNLSPPSLLGLGPYWTFLGQSIGGKTFSPDDGAPDYPNGPWVDNDCYCQLFWNNPGWLLFFRFAGNCTDPSELLYLNNGGTISNAAGTYTRIANIGITGPQSLDIGPLPSTPITNYLSPPACFRLVITGFSGTTLPGCAGMSAPTGITWDGSFTEFSPGLFYYVNTAFGGVVTAAGAGQLESGIQLFPTPFTSITYTPSAGIPGWTLRIAIVFGGVATQVYSGNLLNSASAIGTYVGNWQCPAQAPTLMNLSISTG